jgi:putative methylase
MQKRLVRKLDLERALSTIEPHPAPNAYLEQYTIPSDVAAEILFTAAYVYDDIIDKAVVDLGCGTGRLAIGAALLGARKILGVDVDKTTVRIAQRNAERLNAREIAHWIAGDVDVIHGVFDTVLQNPPFGVQRRGADRKFIERSLELAHTIYSLHKAGEDTREFIKRFIEKRGGTVMNIFTLEMRIPRLFEFHTKSKHMVQVDLYRIEGRAT